MKETDGTIDYKAHQMVLYVEKDTGAYEPLQTGSYMSKNYIDDFWEKRRSIEANAAGRLLAGAISPVEYYMLLLDMTPADVARRVGISVRKVNKHRTPSAFSSVSVKLLKRYADVFGVSVASLFSIAPPSSGALKVTYKQTNNPFIVIMEIDGTAT